MRSWLGWVAAGLLALLPAMSRGDSNASVVSAVPGTDGAAIARFTWRFSQPMVPVGGGDAPLDMACPIDGKGRWIDPATFVWEFAQALPGGMRCEATLHDGLKTAAGVEVSGTTHFTIDAGGPTARAVLPAAANDAIEEDQSFFVATNGPADRGSIAANAYCAVDGIGEKIAVDLLPPDTAERVLPQMGSDYQLQNFLQEAGLPSPLPVRPRDRANALANVVALKCRRPLPPGRDMALVWSGSIRSPAGRTAGEDHRFDFTVRKEFSAKLTCGRVNPRAGCDPVEPITVEFSASVPRARALAVRLDVGAGKPLAPIDEGHDATLESIKFKPNFPEAVTAHLTIPSDFTDESGRPLANARRFPLDVEIDRAPPLVKFAAPFGILEAKQGGVLPVSVRNVEPALARQVKLVAGGAARIDAPDGAIADWVRRVAKAQENDFRDEKHGTASVSVNHTGDTSILRGQPAQHLSLPLPGGGKQFEVVGVPLAQPGFYVVELASPVLGRALLGRDATRYVSAAALVTDMAVHFKWGRAASLAWVTSLDSGQPVANAQVRVTDSCTGRQLAAGAADASGRLLIKGGLPAPTSSDNCASDDATEHPLIVSARASGDFSFTLTSWGDGIRPYDFDLPYGWSAPDAIFHTVLDRTLLRAGETIDMKHFYRLPTASGFRSGGAATGQLALHHRGDDTEFDVPLTLGPDGIGETSWTAPKGAPTGDYDISFKVGDKTVSSDQSFRVDEYRLPTMRASVSGPKPPAVRPKRLPLDLYVGYLSGGGAGRAPIKLRTGWAALDDTPDGWDGWTFGGKPVREGTVSLDADGDDVDAPRLPNSTTIPLSLDEHGALRTDLDIPDLTDSAKLTVEMDYQDANGETLTASTGIPIYGSAVRLGIKPDGWLQRSTDMRLKVVALGLDGKPIRGQRIAIQLYTREILSARRRLIGGFYAFDNNAKTTAISAHCSETTDAQGLATCSLDPGVSGEVIAVATTTDADGHEAHAVASTFLAGEDDWWFGGDNGDRMDIVPDAKSYHAGDTAHVQVRMPFREATALVTVEREGVLASFVTTLSGKDPVVAVPLAGNDAPNAYISVMAVRGRIAGWRLWLADFARRWHLPFFSREGAYPTALVDLAKPSYRIGIAKVAVGWEAHQLRVVVRTQQQRFKVRDHAKVGIAVRGPHGEVPQSAEVAFMAVDEALLQLSPNGTTDLLAAMMKERPLSVLTSTAQTQVVGKRHYGRKALAAGGGGGGDLSALTRADFRPVLLWKGRVKLDANGAAGLVVPLADSLSAYKLVAVASAGEDLFGSGSTEIRTVQDLTIYSGVPPLVRTGDQYGATFTLRNGTDRAMTVTATAALSPAIARGHPITVTVPAGGATPVTWRLTAPEHVDSLRWTVSARSADGRAADRVQVDEQVVPAVPEQVWGATFLRVGANTQVLVAAPQGALPGRGGIDVSLAASPAPPLAGVRDYMLHYPFGCFEQRTSKAVALDDRAAWARLMGELPTYVAGDGLLRYWPDQQMPGSIALTAYALSVTAEDGLAWPDEQKAKLLDTLRGVVEGRVREEGQGPNDTRFLRIAALAALARNGAATPDLITKAAIPLGDMPTALLGDWLVTLQRTTGANPALRAAAEQTLRGRIVYEGTRLDLVDKAGSPWWMMVSDDEMALKALLAVEGQPGWADEAPRMMIGIALRQLHGHWDTTPANAWGTIAAHRFAAAYPGAASGTATVRLGVQSFSPAWPTKDPLRLPLPTRQTPLLLSGNGAGPWATVAVRAAVPLTAPAFAGYRLSREISFVERKAPDRLSRGDVIKVRLTIDAPVDRTWVVVEDPIPAGASIVGGQGGQSALLAGQAGAGSGGWPSYVERGLDAWRGYYGWLPRGRTSVEYVVRVNTAGRFVLPPTRVEAMYSPEIHALLPNQPVMVSP